MTGHTQFDVFPMVIFQIRFWDPELNYAHVSPLKTQDRVRAQMK